VSLPARVLEHCRARLSIPRGARLAIALSGGLDSTVLLEVLLRLRTALEVDLCVATVDHGLRGAAGAADAAFARALAQARGLPCYTMRFEGLAGRGLEDAARHARYAFLRGVPADLVALGHQRDDQAETVLLRILRSADPDGLAGMRPAEGRFVRPLLVEPRAAMLEWARAEGLAWREDASNEELRLERNRLRHEVLPLLETVHGGAARRLAALASLLEPAPDPCPTSFGPALAQGWLGPAVLLACPGEAARGRLLRAFVAGATGRHDGIGLEGARQAVGLVERGREGAWVHIAGGGRLAVVRGGLCCLPPPPEEVVLRLPGVRRWGIYDLQIDRSGADRDPIGLRAPHPGETYRGQPLREWLRRRGVPAALRPYHPMIRLAGGQCWTPPDRPPASSAARGLAMRFAASIALGEQAGRDWSVEL
jgi:tRNA(Ile)-lysidine synthetase-like protein